MLAGLELKRVEKKRIRRREKTRHHKLKKRLDIKTLLKS